jgi:Skp family chaperone for outer membrane proteins
LATKVYSTTVAIVDINYLINNSKHFVEISDKINNSQLEYKKKFINTEKNLYSKKEELEGLKIILNEDEFLIKRDAYYNDVANFENDVAKFNQHYETEMINIKNMLYSKIAELIQNYASVNQIDLILEKNQYLIASDQLNIIEIIFIELNDSQINLKFKKYED